MAAAFEFKPEQRINESELSKTLGVSRTPLREALNRLVAEGLLTSQEGRGFFLSLSGPQNRSCTCMNCDWRSKPKLQWRAVERASDEEIAELNALT